MGSSALDVSIETRNGVVWMGLDGELDMATGHIFGEVLAGAEQDGVTTIMLDLRDLSFIDSTGLHLFTQAAERARLNGHRLLFVGARPSAKRLFEITGTEFILDHQEAVSTLERFTRTPADVVGDPDA